MPRGPKGPSRYDPAKIAVELRRVMASWIDPEQGRPLEQKEFAEILGISKAQISRRMNPNATRPAQFQIDEIGILADLFKAPAFWPWLSWTEAEEHEEAWAKHREQQRKRAKK